jgi:hypothetical protein
MRLLPAGRPPPCSALSFKRWALAPVEAERPGWLEAELIPSLFESGGMVADGRIVVDHYQDHGSLWSIRNAFHSARSSYGYERWRLGAPERRATARWAVRAIPARLRGEARRRPDQAVAPMLEAILIALISGAASGLLFGPGSSPDLVA